MFLHGLVCDFCAVQWQTPQGQVILPSRRLEVMGIKKNGAREENTGGEKESRVSLVRPLFPVPLRPGAYYAG